MPRQWESREEYDDALARWLADVILAEFRRRAIEHEGPRAPAGDTERDNAPAAHDINR